MKLVVVAPDESYASKVREAGATAVPAIADTLEGHPVARGATGLQTLAAVERLVAQGQRPLACGGLDRTTLARCREAGAVGFVLDASLWLLPESPLGEEDKNALAQLSPGSFINGDATLPSGLKVGRDALLAPFVAKRANMLADALAHVLEDARRTALPVIPAKGPRATTPAAPMSSAAPRASSSAAPDTASQVLHDWPYETQPLDEAVAIIGVGAILPKSDGKDAFWKNVLDKVNGIIEVPAERWDADIHYDADHAKPDRTYSKIGGFVTEFTFDPMRFRIPPKTASALDKVQQMALAAAAEALADAGYDKKEFDRSRCAVILGNSLGGEMKDETNKRMHLSEFNAALRATPQFQALPDAEREALVAKASESILAKIPSITEDTMPGELSNVIAGRLANVLNLTGKNLTTDAACASSHAALDTAIRTILHGEADMALCGGADRSMDPGTYVKFSKIGALSATGSTPFDARADGFVMGEGTAILLLKRLSNAMRDGDKIYAVVRGMGSSSDGKGKGITAPNPAGQRLAVERALAMAGIEPRHVGLVEAHGTSTKVGDVVEVESLAAIYKGLPVGSVGLGSVKSQIGHLKSAAGAAGMLKAALALHHKTLPPSANFETPNPNIDWANIPFRVITEATPWPQPPGGEPRRAAVSAFGFGGTNFHVILEEYVPAYHERALTARRPAATTATAASVGMAAPRPSTPIRTKPAIEGELVVLGAESPAALAQALRAAADTARALPDVTTAAPRVRVRGAHAMPHRFAVGAGAHATLVDALEAAAPIVEDEKMRAALPIKVKGAAYGAGPRITGKIAFLFPGQGSQYVNMMAALAKRHAVVSATFAEADAVLEPLLGQKLTSVLFCDATDKAAVGKAEEALRQTEVTQPAMLAADVAMHRLLAEHGVHPDMVAGHSLGEYAALVAGGVLSFKDALLAVSARGKEMANVHVEDKGLMASFSAGPEDVQRILDAVDGYVVAANKNCPVQTVVAGATEAVKKAVALGEKHGIQTMMLPVSAAFHTSIVAPASEPLRRVLEGLEFSAPKLPVYTNVDATPYPSDPAAIRDILAKQVAAPVEWVAELQALYDAGARVFVEVGPKRALTGFVEATLGKQEGVHALLTNHPKRGDMESFLDALAKMSVLGFDLGLEVVDAPAPAPVAAAAVAPPTAPVPNASPTAAAGSTEQSYETFRSAVAPALEAALKAGYDTFAAERARLTAVEERYTRFDLHPVDVVVSGASLGLPGSARRVFDDGNFDRMFAGENRIDRLDASWAARFIEKDIVRLVKGEGEPVMLPVREAAEVLKLAGRKGALDLAADYETDQKLLKTLDVTSKLALAAAYEALLDAGIPLVREQTVMRNGKKLPGGWVLPPHMRNDTAIVFASAFPGYDNLVAEVSKQLAKRYAGRTLEGLDKVYNGMVDALPADKRGALNAFYAEHRGELQRAVGNETELVKFNRHFLFSVLSMGHAEVAEILRCRGPNTQVNAACASTTQAVAIGEDWMRTGRARRVLVLGADDVTSDNLLEWIGSGFLASGAATTEDNVEEAALPFDRRRHGMIIGMGAVGLVLERLEDVESRGMVPVARLLASRIANSAHHGSRLDIEHIARETRGLIETAAKRAGLSPERMGEQTLFVSHETYTPARGGSASAEAAALRAGFGAGAPKVLITNTKGFTGHAMGAGLEDAIAVKALQFNRAPPIANLREIDPDFVDLTLSKGGAHDRRFAMRFAAGFGSQLAITVFEKMADGEKRIIDAARYQSFLDLSAEGSGAKAERVKRTLRITSFEEGAPRPAAAALDAPPTRVALAPAAPTAADRSQVLPRVIALVSEKTGYPADVLDTTLDMEADLGIDTVKQAEIFGALREQYALPREEGVKIKDYPTLGHVAEYVTSRLAAAPALAAPAVPAAAPPTAAVHPPAPTASPTAAPAAPPTTRSVSAGPAPSGEGALAKVTAIIAEKTGYPTDILDPTLDMEADLGIDTVKQAEIFGEVRELFSIPRLEGIKIKDYPTIGHVARFVSDNAGKGVAPAPTPATEAHVGEVKPAAAATPLARRVPRVVEAPATGETTRRPYVSGSGLLTDALRGAFPAHEGDTIVFEGTPRELFLLAKKHVEALTEGRIGILAVTHLGGDHGIATARNWEDGGVTGMVKALAAEFPKAFVRALDLDPSEPADARIDHVRAELGISVSPVEVGRTANGRIVVQTVQADALAPAKPELSEGSVLVVTGGARGITAEALQALAPSKPVLVLLGRTAAPEDQEADLDDAQLARMRDEAKKKLLARGERATPVAIERAVAPAKARAEVARNLRAMRAAGATVDYRACDVTDLDALRGVLDDVRATHGPIEGVLHAAGVEESKPLADKDDGAFERAWLPKAAAAGVLAQLTASDPVKFFVMFGSVAGRYGNAAQADYSAANDALAKLARRLRARGTPAVVMCWGPWGETGMATRGSTLTVLRSVGVEPITTAEGVEAFLTELAHLSEPEVVLAKSLGVLEAQSGDVVRTLTLRADDPVMDHHRVDGVAYLAGVRGLQAFVENAHFDVQGFEDVHFDYPVKLLRDAPVDATVTVTPDGHATVTTIPPGPRPEPRTHFRARLVHSPAPVVEAPPPEGAAWAHDDIYPPFFHGPAFQVLAETRRISPTGIEVQGAEPEKGVSAMAATLEGALQSLGLWGLAAARRMALPERVGRIALFGAYEPGATTYRVTQACLEEGRVCGDVACIVGGRVVALLNDVRLIVTGEASLSEPPALWRTDEVDVAGVPLVRVPTEDARLLLSAPSVLATRLTPEERETLAAFTVEKRREEWLAATLAAKSALRLAGDARDDHDISIMRGEDGAPLAHDPWGLTLTHAAGIAVACAYPLVEGRVGVDVERVEERPQSFEAEGFTDDERSAWPSGDGRAEAVTRAWCAKEAVLKALGTGLSLDLHDVRVRVTRDRLDVELVGQAKERFTAIEGERLDVSTGIENGIVTAVARVQVIQRA